MSALLLWTLLTASTPTPNSAALFMQSQMAMMDGDLATAERLARESVEKDPRSADLKTAYAEILLHRGDVKKAQGILEDVLHGNPDQEEAITLLASIAAAGQDWAMAEDYARRAFTLHKTEPNAFMFGQVLARQQQFKEAAGVLRGATSHRALELLSRLDRALGDAQGEEAALQELHGRYPDDRNALLALAELLERGGDVLQAARLLEGIPAEERTTAQAIHLAGLYRKGGDCARALEILEKVPATEAEAQNEKTQCRLRNGDWEGAEEILNQAIAAAPDNLAARFLLLRLRLLDGRLEEAGKMIASLEQDTPASAAAFLQLERALWLQLRGDFGAAVELLTPLLDNPEVRSEAGQSLFDLQQARECPQAALDAALDLWRREGGSSHGLHLVIQAWLQLGDLPDASPGIRYLEESLGFEGAVEAGWLLAEHAFPAEALEAAREMAGRYGASRDSRFLKAGAYEKSGQWQKAEEEFKALVRDAPGDAQALNYLGYMLTERTTRFAEARGYIETALRLQPESGAFLDSLGWVQFSMKEYPAAYETLTRAFRKEPLDATVLEHLGDAALAVGKKEEALRRYGAALNLPGHNSASLLKKIAALSH